MDSNKENHTSPVHRSAAAVISNNVLAERLQERIQTLAEEHPELFISKEEAEAVGLNAIKQQRLGSNSIPAFVVSVNCKSAYLILSAARTSFSS